MDPLSITASVIAIIQIADRIASVCKDYIITVKDAPNDLRTILIEVGSVKCVLEVLQLLISGAQSDIPQKLGSPDGPIKGCKEALALLERQLPTPFENSGHTKRRKIDNLVWPFKETRARKALEDIARHKSTISLALTTEVALDVKDIKSNVKHIYDKIDEKERNDILKWIVTTDPSSTHDRAWNLREPQTGKWLISCPEYNEWKIGIRRFLWFHGIPGAGKTILASYIIEDMKSFCKTNVSEGTTWIYYYCLFRHEQDETLHCLNWIVSQLCRRAQHIPDDICEAYREDERLSIAKLINALYTLSGQFTRIYLVVDALDESHNRSNLLDVLLKLASDNKLKNVQLVVMSRKEVDIGKKLKDASTAISLSNPHVDEDIKVYIQSHLRQDNKFDAWPDWLKKETENALVRKAKGMFRWAFCQLDILGRLRTIPDIRIALTELPDTLDETYERILTKIPDKNRKHVHKVLQILSYDLLGTPTLEELAEIVVVDVEQLSFNPDDRFLQLEDLLEMCTCLVSYDDTTTIIDLAHYSVREYIESERVKPNSFHLDEYRAKVLLAKTSIIYMLSVDYRLLSNYPLIDLFIECWTFYIDDIECTGGDSIVFDLLLKLLNPSRDYFANWLACQNDSGTNIDMLPIWEVAPGDEATATLAYLGILDFQETAKILLQRNLGKPILEGRLKEVDPRTCIADIEGTPLQVAVLSERPEIVRLLLQNGADANSSTNNGSSLLITVLRQFNGKIMAFTNIIEQLIDAGANLSSNVVWTALQALARRDRADFGDDWYNLAKMFGILLEAGVDVNGVSSDDAVIADILREQGCEDTEDAGNENLSASVQEMIQNRGTLSNYDTPLRLLEKAWEERGWTPQGPWGKEGYDEITDLLKSHGAKSLHLFPIKGLPGYVEEDMEEFTRLTTQEGSYTTFSPSPQPLQLTYDSDGYGHF